MKVFLLIFFSFIVFFTYSCGTDNNATKDSGCKINLDCKDGQICNGTTHKCEEKVETNVLTSIEVDIENSVDAKKASLLVGENKTIIAYGIYDKNETDARDISRKVRWYSSISSVGIAKKNNDGQIKFEAKSSGTTEIYCKYKGEESEHVTFIVSDGIIESINISSNIGNSIFLHQSPSIDVIATYVGENQKKIDLNEVELHSSPEGLSKNENGNYKFSEVGAYDIWATKEQDGSIIESNHISIEVKANVVSGLELTYNRDLGEFIVNTPHEVIIKEKLEGNGERILDNTLGLTWKIETREDQGDGSYKPIDSVEGTDYEISGFNITFKKVDVFYVTVSKTYGENTFNALDDFTVIEAK